MPRTIQCVPEEASRGLDFAPYPGDLGKRIYNKVSKEAWQLWLKHQTMLVNENRLNHGRPARPPVPRAPDGELLLRRGAEQPAGYVPPSA